ncbi:MAG TPA: hypothetical protein VEU78_08430 [Steroidobacteraceae bacterium]|nr:hypothetical protein [Steroidobacteraceae bacterium]
MKHFARVLYLAVPVLLGSCGGGGGYGGGPNPQNASPGGIWSGTDSDSPLQVTGIIDESGNLRFIRADGVQYVGTATTSGNSISAHFDAYTPFGSAFADGSTHETGSLSGTIDARVSITASTQSMTDKGTPSNGTLALTFNPLYDQASSLAAIAGNYVEAGSGTAVSIGANGAIFSQDATTGCVVNGTVAIINASYDAYAVQATYASCTGADAVLNGITFSGLATLNTSVSPMQLIAGVTGSGGGTTYAIVDTLNHQ